MAHLRLAKTMSAEKLYELFKDNQLKGNADRFHLILSTADSN